MSSPWPPSTTPNANMQKLPQGGQEPCFGSKMRGADPPGITSCAEPGGHGNRRITNYEHSNIEGIIRHSTFPCSVVRLFPWVQDFSRRFFGSPALLVPTVTVRDLIAQKQ
jgi:hypothetical protein